MKLFESSYKADGKYYARLYDTEKNETIVEEYSSKYEYYTPNNKGIYKCITDNVKLDKHLGFYKDTQGQYGVFNPTDRYIRDNHWKKSFNHSPRIWYLDIETRATRNEFPVPEKALEEISLIQIYDSKTEVMYVLGLKDFIHQEGYETEFDTKYIKCKNEKHLLEVYCLLFKKMNPLILYAWNGQNFDYPYIFNRLKYNNIDTNLMSNYNCANITTFKDDNNRTLFDISIDGHYYLDLMLVYKKFTFGNLPSYSLDSISKLELNDSKVEHNEFIDFDSFYTGKNYEISKTPYNDRIREEIRQLKILEKNKTITKEQETRLDELISFQFVYYGIKDVFLLKKIDDKKNFTNIMISISETLGCEVCDTLGTIKPWGNGLKNTYYEKNLIVPPKQNFTTVNVAGGYVRHPVTGIHTWMLSEDVNSMYPMLSMEGFNMSPETYIPLERLPEDIKQHVHEYYNDQDEGKILNYSEEVKEKTKELLKKYNYAMGINGAIFDRSVHGVVPQMVSDIYYGRKKDKKEMLKYEQQVEIINDILRTRK